MYSLLCLLPFAFCAKWNRKRKTPKGMSSNHAHMPCIFAAVPSVMKTFCFIQKLCSNLRNHCWFLCTEWDKNELHLVQVLIITKHKGLYNSLCPRSPPQIVYDLFLGVPGSSETSVGVWLTNLQFLNQQAFQFQMS